VNAKHICLVPALAVTLALLSACTQPAVAPKPPAFQESAVTVRDWDRVASHIASDMERSGLLPGTTASPGQALAPKAYYIHAVSNGSAFLNSVRDALTSEILSRGGSVAALPVGATVINLDVDWVRWGSRPAAPNGTGTLSGLKTGLLVSALDLGAGTPADKIAQLAPLEIAALTAGLGLTADVVRALTPTQGSEAAWRAYIVSPTQVLFHVREPIYVETSDLPLYHASTRTGSIPSPGPSVALISRPLQFAR
jgi:hypothetical protein